MSERQLDSYLSPASRRALGWAGRHASAVVVGGVLAAATYLVVVQEGNKQGLTDLDFARGLALSVGADGVSRNEVGSTGLYASLAIGVGLMLLHALVVPRLVRRAWWLQALPVLAVVFLAWGFGFSPARPSGVLGLEAGGVVSMLVFLVGAAGFALVGVRAYSLIAGSAWWEPKESLLERDLEDLVPGDTSLELPEQRGEEGGVRPRG